MNANFIFILLFTLIAANLPFLNEKLFALITLSQANQKTREKKHKAIGWRLLELVVYYIIVGLIARLLESRIDNIADQNWQFYVITGCLFLVFAFPGFTYRFLLKRSQL